MSAPALAVWINGVSQVSADNLNTYQQWCVNAAQLRTLTGLTGMMVFMQGFSSVGDGGQGSFYWNPSSTSPDDNGITTVIPNGSVAGAWNRIIVPALNTTAYYAPVTGFSITIPNYANAVILNPAATLAAGTLDMPIALFNGSSLIISSSQTITALTLTPQSGQTIYGAPSSISATTPVQFIYLAAQQAFFRSA